MKIVTESLEYLVRILSICDIYERLYSLDNLSSTKHLNDAIINLYESIIEYLFYAKRYLEQNTFGKPESLEQDLPHCAKHTRRTDH
jgi:hypothetical protein